MGYQDDTHLYLVGSAAENAADWENPTFQLEVDGHRLRNHTCSLLAPPHDSTETGALPMPPARMSAIRCAARWH